MAVLQKGRALFEPRDSGNGGHYEDNNSGKHQQWQLFAYELWNRIPKNTFVQLKTLQLGAYDAVSAFNKGNISKCLVLNNLGLQVGKHSAKVFKTFDDQRIWRADRLNAEIQKKARQSKQLSKKKLEELYAEEKGPYQPSYASGSY
ncbi:hypothetical protein J6590_091405 [Homalodisca vitripennis]|nr:hypothetical protein J6590_091405 [Homalodisca vitripennis]